MMQVVCCSGAVVCLVLSSAVAQPVFQKTVVAFNNQVVTGMPGVYGDIQPACVDPSGNIFFHAQVHPAPGVGPARATIFSRSTSGQWRVVASPVAQPIPGLNPSNDFSYGSLLSVSSANIAFSAGTGNFGGSAAVVSADAGSVGVVAQAGGIAPQRNGAVFSNSFTRLSQGSSGHLAFKASTVQSGGVGDVGLGIWGVGLDRQASLVFAESGLLGPSIPLARLRLDNSSTVHVSPTGKLAGSFQIFDGGVNFQNDRVAILATPDSKSVFARTGMPISGDPTRVFNTIAVSPIGRDGTIAVNGDTRIPDVIASNRGALYFSNESSPDQMHRVLMTREPLPQRSNFEVWTIAGVRLGTGENFVTTVQARSSSGVEVPALIAGTPGNLVTIAANFDQVPGLAPGTFFANGNVSQFSAPQINAVGSIAFVATFSGTDAINSSDYGIFASSTTGGLHLIARTGDLVTLSPGVSKTISVLDMAFGSDAMRGTALSDSNLLLYRAQFTDGTFALIETQIPSPSGLALIATAAALASRRRRAVPQELK